MKSAVRVFSVLPATLGIIAAASVGCTPADETTPTELSLSAPLFAVSEVGGNLTPHLSGGNEVFTPAIPGDPTPADSRAQGQAFFRIRADGDSVEFRLIASNISNITQAHIHCGAAGNNGSIRMWLYPNVGPTGAQGPAGQGRHDGVLATGVFGTTGIVCPTAAGVPANTSLIDAIRGGLAYVNVHTNDGVAPTNQGPGDFSGGEIRGQF